MISISSNEDIAPERRAFLVQFLMEETNYTELNEKIKSTDIKVIGSFETFFTSCLTCSVCTTLLLGILQLQIPLRQRRTAWRKASASNSVTRPVISTRHSMLEGMT